MSVGRRAAVRLPERQPGPRVPGMGFRQPRAGRKRLCGMAGRAGQSMACEPVRTFLRLWPAARPHPASATLNGPPGAAVGSICSPHHRPAAPAATRTCRQLGGPRKPVALRRHSSLGGGFGGKVQAQGRPDARRRGGHGRV